MIAPVCVKASIYLPLCCSWYTGGSGHRRVLQVLLHCSTINPNLPFRSKRFMLASSYCFKWEWYNHFTVFNKQKRLNGAAIFTLFHRVWLEKTDSQSFMWLHLKFNLTWNLPTSPYFNEVHTSKKWLICAPLITQKWLLTKWEKTTVIQVSGADEQILKCSCSVLP